MNIDMKIVRINTLIKRLEGGGDVTTSSMKRVLTPSQIKELKTDWDDELSNRRVQKPTQLKTYERMIRVGCLHYQKMEKYSFTKDKNRSAKKFSDKAEVVFEKAIEYLIEQLQADSNLRMWIDREPDGSNLTPMGVPRVIGSSSFECLVRTKTPYPVFTKRELKLRALESALSKLTGSSLESLDVTEERVHFLKPKNLDFSSFSY